MVAGGPVYVGNYTSDAGPGLVVARPSGNALAEVTRVELANPSWLARRGGHCYVVDESEQGAVSAVSLADPWLPRVQSTRQTGGAAPTHCCVHGDWLVTANYGSGSLAVHPIEPDGSLGERTDLVQHGEGAHAHQVLPDPSRTSLLAVDIGLDTVFVYRMHDGKLREHSRTVLPTSSGPRHLCFHPNGWLAYLAHEYESTLTVLRWDAGAGLLRPGQVVGTRPSRPGKENYPAEVAVSEDGRYVYVSNRGDNTIAGFAVDGSRIRPLEAVPCGGDWPRHIALKDGYVYVANQRSGTVAWLRRDPASGALTRPAGTLAVPAAAMVLP